MDQHIEPNPRLVALQRKGLAAAVIGGIGLLAGLLIGGSSTFFESYLYAFMLWNGLSLGCLSALMLHHMVAGRWGFMIQRFLEAGARNVVLGAVLIIPLLLFGMTYLYPWLPGTQKVLPGELAELIAHKRDDLIVPGLHISWYNKGFFIVRAAIYFAVWIFLALRLSRLSYALDKTGDQRLVLKMRSLSAFGLVLYVLTMTFAACDWSMSLEPEWFSTIYGPLYIVGQGLMTLAFSIIMLNKVADDKPHAPVVKTEYFHHLGSLTCGFVVLWSYIQFSQFLITYSGNLPEEIPWYLRRQSGGLDFVAVILIVFHFFLPLFILLQRRVKRARRGLLTMARWLFLAHIIDLFWIITPAFHPNSLGGVVDILTYAAAIVGIGGVWVWLFVRNLLQHSLLPLHDERMDEALGIGPFAHQEAPEHA